MPAPQVRSDHAQLEQASRQFEQERAAVQKTLEALKQNLDQLQGGGWVGQAAKQFFQEMNSSVLPSLKALERALGQAAQTTTRISIRLRQAEEDAARVLDGHDVDAYGPAPSGGGGTPGGGSTPGDGGGTPGGGGGADPRAEAVQKHIDAGDRQTAIEEAIKQYGLDLKNVNGTPQYDSSTSGEGATSPDGSVSIGDDAFSSPGWLASSIGHEAIHADQAKEGRWYTDDEGTALNEVEAYDWELRNAKANGLSDAEVKEIESRRQSWYDQLSPDVQKRVDKGDYTMP